MIGLVTEKIVGEGPVVLREWWTPWDGSIECGRGGDRR